MTGFVLCASDSWYFCIWLTTRFLQVLWTEPNQKARICRSGDWPVASLISILSLGCRSGSRLGLGTTTCPPQKDAPNDTSKGCDWISTGKSLMSPVAKNKCLPRVCQEKCGRAGKRCCTARAHLQFPQHGSRPAFPLSAQSVLAK